MAASKVYFADFQTRHGENLMAKLSRLIKKAGMDQIDFDGKYTAIKIHFGELGNLAFLRPNWAKVVADEIKALGGRPFLTDCNTLYVGSRKNALDHLDTAYTNGFTPMTTGCHVIIADGLKGTDDVYVPVDGEYVKEAKVGRALMDADILVSLTHFKGHEAAGFGGAIKNIGMGGGSRAGKMEQHAAGKPIVKQENCVGCGLCLKSCAHEAISITDKKATIDHNRCVGCGRCIDACPRDAASQANDDTNELLNRKMAEYTLAICQGRPHFHISLVMDISPYCDCYGQNDIPILPDVGMFASFDPVALDQACADACMKLNPMPGSRLFRMEKKTADPFINNHPGTDWRSQLDQAEKIGLGQREYELIDIG